MQFTGTAPLLVFGGPYSNREAVLALRAEARCLGIGADRIICTGDTIAYCADPEETVALIRDWGVHIIAGNCEEQVAARAADCGCGFDDDTTCNVLSKGWYPYANAHVSDASRSWMATLPTTLRFNYGGASFRVVHGGVTKINKFIFASEAATLASEAASAHADVVIAGHMGLPFIARTGRQVWFNAGVIGMPANDGTADTWFGLITASDDAVKLETRRLSYDFHTAAARLRRSGHANTYARSLVTGLWPSLDILPEAEQLATGKRLRPKSLVFKRTGSSRHSTVNAAAL